MAFSVVFVSLLYGYYQVRTQRQNLSNDLSRRSAVFAENIQENLDSSGSLNDKNLNRIVERYGQREHLLGVAVYDVSGTAIAITPGLSEVFAKRPRIATQAEKQNAGVGQYLTLNGMSLHVYALPLQREKHDAGSLAVVYDASFIDSRVFRTLRDSLLSTLVQTGLIIALTLFLVRSNFVAPLATTAKWLRHLRADPSQVTQPLPEGELFAQLHAEARHLARDLSTARAAAQEEAQLRESQLSLWTAERLRVSLQTKLQGDALLVASNREPYMHVFDEKDHKIRVVVPASGLVTALEPVLKACEGTWVANGSGNADREVVDEYDHLQVPPHRPSYILRRVWLSQEEEQGYYEGFSNEGLWPLCHIAHTRPVFRPGDWMYYQRVNRRFADAVLSEMEGTKSPILLVQDYHFALLPRMVKDARPDARVAMFWHIPWPNAEAFGICPWQRELVDGLLGADLIGFHIQTHCNNFMQTVDRAVEALTDWDRFEVSRKGHVTRVRPYPISVAFAPEHQGAQVIRITGEGRAALFTEIGVEASLLGVGVDRLDYTKGILERFRAVERFLEMYPVYQRRFTFVQIGAPSRTDIPRYQQFLDEVTNEANRINVRFQAGRWKPIVLLKRHHSHEEIERYFRAASVCLVTSLHDGMNLVAKEFVASRDDNRGALILSTFTGAARELTDALLVNPYDVDQMANAIHQALEFSEDEQFQRMSRMRKTVHDHNIYRWAANLLSDLAEIRVEAAETTEAARA
ncbi:MAG TPA: trehalose-6-phosphate synthase [Methylomirabilota bacterium]|nr:trehalose-6-phosphate synthase [Methylomirabilota bacterium]